MKFQIIILLILFSGLANADIFQYTGEGELCILDRYNNQTCLTQNEEINLTNDYDYYLTLKNIQKDFTMENTFKVTIIDNFKSFAFASVAFLIIFAMCFTFIVGGSR